MKPKDSSPEPIRDLIADLLAILGMTSVTIGSALMWIPLGFIVAGICSILIGWRLSQGASCSAGKAPSVISDRRRP